MTLRVAFIGILIALGLPSFAQGRGGPANVFVEEVQAREFATRVEALGTLEPKEQVDLSVNASDRVTAVYFDDGQRVRKGDTLLSQAQREQAAQVEAAQANVRETRSSLERLQKLREQDAISEAAYEAARRDYDSAMASLATVQSRQRDRVLVAPFDGVLGFRRVSVGAFLSPGQVVARLIDDSEMRLEFAVPSIYLREVSIGTKIVARSDDLPGETFTGEVTSIDNAIDPVTRSFRVRATLPNPDRTMRAGMLMLVDLLASPSRGLAIPEAAVQPLGPRNFVYVAEREGDQLVARRREVQIGKRERGVVEVVSGLSAGERVITDGLIRVREGAPIVARDPAMLQPDAGSRTPSSAGANTVSPGR